MRIVVTCLKVRNFTRKLKTQNTDLAFFGIGCVHIVEFDVIISVGRQESLFGRDSIFDRNLRITKYQRLNMTILLIF